MESQHLSQKAFAQSTGISEGTLSGMLNDRTRPTLQIVESIHNRFPNISLEWLLYGNGPMEKPASGSKAGEGLDNEPSNAQGAISQQPASSTLFGAQQAARISSVGQTVGNAPKEVVKYIDKPARKITEIRVFYDDQTWESFSPKH